MLIFECPCCGLRADETELAPGGEAHLRRAGPEADPEALEAYLFLRENPFGVHFERWRHAYGCGKWFHAARDTRTMEVFGTYSAQTTAPPEELLRKIDAKRPGWRWRDWGEGRHPGQGSDGNGAGAGAGDAEAPEAKSKNAGPEAQA